MFANLGQGRKRARKLKIREAMKLLTEEEAAKLVNDEDLKTSALKNVEQNGIVFLDEIDKIAARQETHGADVSRHGVQRDLLPLVEGTTVSTKHGMIKTDHILFIASGAFHLSKPSDLIPELQGRFPIRVELAALSEADFVRILTEPENALLKQYTALLKADDAQLVFDKAAVREIASLATRLNSTSENIGARRLQTVLSTLLEDVLFDVPDPKLKRVRMTREEVIRRLGPVVADPDLARYIL